MLTGRPAGHRSQRRALGRAARAPRRPAADRPRDGRARLGRRRLPSAGRCRSCGPAARPSCSAGRGSPSRSCSDRAPRGAARGPRPALADPWLPRRLPANRAARDRARPARRRDPRRRHHERAGAGRRYRRAGRGRSWRATRAPSPATWQQIGRAGRRQGHERRASSWRRARRSTATSSTTRSSSSTARRRRPASTRTTSTSCSPTCARATFELPFEPGEVFGPGPADDLLAFIAEERPRPPGRATGAGTGARRTSRRRRSRCGPRRRRTS